MSSSMYRGPFKLTIFLKNKVAQTNIKISFLNQVALVDNPKILLVHLSVRYITIIPPPNQFFNWMNHMWIHITIVAIWTIKYLMNLAYNWMSPLFNHWSLHHLVNTASIKVINDLVTMIQTILSVTNYIALSPILFNHLTPKANIAMRVRLRRISLQTPCYWIWSDRMSIK
jgi:hypothetical protein